MTDRLSILESLVADLTAERGKVNMLEKMVIDLVSTNNINTVTNQYRRLENITTSMYEFPNAGGEPNSGDTAWMLTATALVLFMTMPGLAIYYSGMVREKNVLACTMQVFTLCSLVTVLWFIFGYRYARGK